MKKSFAKQPIKSFNVTVSMETNEVREIFSFDVNAYDHHQARGQVAIAVETLYVPDSYTMNVTNNNGHLYAPMKETLL